jgi:NADH-quinone oxidoreductase subunit M
MLLTTVLTPLVVLGSFNDVEKRERFYYFLIMAMEFAMLGAFVALDVFLFYVFWEAMLIPMYFLIGRWGSGNRVYAAVKFFLYTFVGSAAMVAAMVVIQARWQWWWY